MASPTTGTFDSLREIIAKIGELHPESVLLNSRLDTDLDLDSMAMVEIAVETQDTFAVRILDDDLRSLRTVADIVDYLERRRAGA